MVGLLARDRMTVQHLGVAGIALEDSPALRSALLETGVFKTVITEARTVCLSDVTSTPAALLLPDSLPRAASLLIAPLVMRGHVDGWICLADKLGFDSFSEEDEQVAPALADQMAVAYAHAQLYSDSIKYASKLEAEIAQRARVITQLTRAEEKVRESEQRLQSVIENLSEGLIVSDLNGHVLHWNHAAFEIHGFISPEECDLKLPEFSKIFELSDPDGSVLDLEQWPLQRIIRGERLRNLEVRIRRLDSDWNRVFSYGGTIVGQANGSFAAVVTISDITDRRLAYETASKLASIVESSHDAIIGKTVDGLITSWNQSAQRLYGYSAEEVLGRSIAILAPAELSDEIDAILEKLRRGGRIEDFETDRITKEGKRISVLLTISPIRGKSGAVSGWSTIARDITQRNRSEEARRASELRYRRLFESAKDGILILNADTGQIVDANPYLMSMLSYSREELIGKELWEIGAFNDIAAARDSFEELRDKGYVRYDDLPLVNRAGVKTEVEFVSNVYSVGEGKVIQCDIRNISERRRAEREIEETNRKLETTLEELSATTQQLWQTSKLATMGELSASIAHELNNPLATVALRVENMLMQMSADDQKVHSLEVISQEVDRMANLVNSLLHFSRRSHRQISTVDVREEIGNSVEFVHYYLRSREIEVVREFADPLPTIQADCQQLRQLFLNLLTNASDAMPQAGKVTVSAQPSVLDHSEAVLVEFTDTGEGIAAENLKKIWDSFFTTKPEGKGTGLGLAICRRIVEDHGGTIEIESEPGRGTTARMIFPATASGIAASFV